MFLTVFVPEGESQVQYYPWLHGRWQGSNQLVQITNEHPTETLREIAHAVVLPEPDGQVLLWCFSECLPDPSHGGTSFGPTHTWLWKSGDPQRVTKKDVPNGSFNGAKDLFCGGHQWLPNGDLLAFGGTDMIAGCSSKIGHDGVFRFRKTAGVWDWNPVPEVPMPSKRWYASGFMIPGDELMVVGAGLPTPSQSQDRFVTNLAPAWSAVPNEPFVAGCATGGGTLHQVDTYPRGFVLAHSGWFFWADVRTGSADHFLDLNDPCPLSSVRDRWFSRATSPVFTPHINGTAVHYVTYDTSGLPVDTIYYIAGDVTNQPGVDVHRIVNPDMNPAVDPTGWTTFAPLNHAREDPNCVILADGSMLVVGGVDFVGGQPDYQHEPERFKPVEVFGAQASTAWEDMWPESEDREYHFVAGLLPDGRVFSAGGETPGSQHSIETYRPPYLFGGPRPLVSNLTSTAWTYGGPYQATVQFNTGVTFARAALIRNAAVTHGFDVSQRYVEVRLTQLPQPTGNPDEYLLTMQAPTGPFPEATAPKGPYMLFIVDSTGVPSVATLVTVG